MRKKAQNESHRRWGARNAENERGSMERRGVRVALRWRVARRTERRQGATGMARGESHSDATAGAGGAMNRARTIMGERRRTQRRGRDESRPYDSVRTGHRGKYPARGNSTWRHSPHPLINRPQPVRRSSMACWGAVGEP
jgi:hypothetical protein